MKRLLLLGAVVCFGLAVIGLDLRVNLIALGLFLYAVRELV